LWRLAQKIQARLGGDRSGLQFPDKPRGMHAWLRDEGIELPIKSHDEEGRCIAWKLPLYNTVHNILTNPYAGAYAFGRTTSKAIVEDARKRAAWTSARSDGLGWADILDTDAVLALPAR
jgi:hypothetical protein